MTLINRFMVDLELSVMMSSLCNVIMRDVIDHDAGIHPRLPVLIRLTNQQRGSRTRGDPGGTKTSTDDSCHGQLSL